MYSLGFGFPGHWEWVVLLIIGLLLFGRRLPDVGRNVGRAIVEFKKGVKGISDEIEEESSHPDRERDRSLGSGETARLSPPAAPTVAHDPHAASPASQPTEQPPPRATPATE
jgi:sec-independent protein translocase protein TatA